MSVDRVVGSIVSRSAGAARHGSRRSESSPGRGGRGGFADGFAARCRSTHPALASDRAGFHDSHDPISDPMLLRPTVLLTLLVLAATAAAQDDAAAARPPRAPNVLFVAIDDLRPELGCYGAEHAITPHFDRLAATGQVFTDAHCQQAVCNPSRASLMTGLRPETLGVLDLRTDFRTRRPDAVTLSQHFGAHGYRTWAIGKIFHNIFHKIFNKTFHKIFLRQKLRSQQISTFQLTTGQIQLTEK